MAKYIGSNNFCFHKQETNYTCGPACMKMMLSYFGIKISEKKIAKLMNTNKVVGTRNKYFPIVAEKFLLNYVVMRNANVVDLKKFLQKGFIVIVCYVPPGDKEGHYSVLKKITRKDIYFFDPFFGESHKYSIERFLKIWKCVKYDNEKKWFFGAGR